MSSTGDSTVPHTRLAVSPDSGGRPTLPPIGAAAPAHGASSPLPPTHSPPGATGGAASPHGGQRSPVDGVDAVDGTASRQSHPPRRSSRGVCSPPRSPREAASAPAGARRPSSIMGSRRVSVTPSRRSSVFSQTGLHRTDSAHRPWEPRGPREPRPWTPRASVAAEELTPQVEAAIEREMGRECQILWCSRNMHVWYAFVIVLPMLVALGVGVWADYQWLQATAGVVLGVYVLMYVAGLLNLIICGRDCRHGFKTRTAAYCEALLTAVVPGAVMIALIVYISVQA